MPQTAQERYNVISAMILRGQLDEFLDPIAMTIDNRRKLAARQRSYELEPGDFIVLPTNTKPRMLSGQIVIYEGQDASKLRVRLTATYSPKWTKGHIIRIPPTMVGRVVKANKGEVDA